MEDNLLSPGLIEAGLIPAPVRTLDSLRVDIMTACNTCCGSFGNDPVDNELACQLDPVIDCVLPRLVRLAAKDASIAGKLPSEWILRHARQTQQDLINEGHPSE